MTESLNMGTLSKTGPGTPEAYKQHWPDEDDPRQNAQSTSNRPPDLYDDNHDSYAEFDEDLFQGRDK